MWSSDALARGACPPLGALDLHSENSLLQPCPAARVKCLGDRKADLVALAWMLAPIL
jgi:hypothetical protein